ncbi:hypothetical protein MG293_000014 [Ovis ammon polii]|uniref:Uncharacterized protein n=1 Tax=Ovis ammon polii TaxID=230172 RepID=A0AAD4UPH8_OVIAM|nr:hypothetical protein MG293_000014 [Ovis ammon polii]
MSSQVLLVVKNPPASAGDVGLIPRLGRSPGVGNDNRLQSSCLENSMDSGAWSMDGLNAKLSAKEEISVLNSSIVIDRDMILSEKRCDHVPMAFGERREIAFSPWLAKLLKMDESPILKRSMTDSTGKRALLHFDAASQYSTDESLEKNSLQLPVIFLD